MLEGIGTRADLKAGEKIIIYKCDHNSTTAVAATGLFTNASFHILPTFKKSLLRISHAAILGKSQLCKLDNLGGHGVLQRWWGHTPDTIDQTQCDLK